MGSQIPVDRTLVGRELWIATTRGSRIAVRVMDVQPYQAVTSLANTATPGMRLEVQIVAMTKGEFSPNRNYPLFFLEPNDEYKTNPPYSLMIAMADIAACEVGKGYWGLLHTTQDWWFEIADITIG